MADRRHESARTFRITAYGIAILALGLLLWVRFIIATDHPRTAIAEPATESAPATVDASESSAHGAP